MTEAKYKSGSTPAGTTVPQAPQLRTSLRTPLAAVLLAVTLTSACSASNDYKPSPATATMSTPPKWDASGHAEAQEAAATVLRTWSRPKMAYEAWWADLKPLLSPEARDVYSYTDPANIPGLKVTGPGVETNNDNPFVVTITFPTTKGKFGVDLSRTSLPGKWIGESIIFPGETSRLQ